MITADILISQGRNTLTAETYLRVSLSSRFYRTQPHRQRFLIFDRPLRAAAAKEIGTVEKMEVS